MTSRRKSSRPAALDRTRIGPRVELRHPELKDAEEFLKLVRASTLLHHPWVYPPSDRREFSGYVDRANTDRHQCFVVTRRSDAAILGVVNLNEIVRSALQGAYLGYWIGVPHLGFGYMTEAIRLVVRHAFTVLALHRIEANIQPGNLPSIALARRCGFSLEGYSPRYLRINGRWRDHQRWAIHLERWKKLPANERILRASS